MLNYRELRIDKGVGSADDVPVFRITLDGYGGLCTYHLLECVFELKPCTPGCAACARDASNNYFCCKMGESGSFALGCLSKDSSYALKGAEEK